MALNMMPPTQIAPGPLDFLPHAHPHSRSASVSSVSSHSSSRPASAHGALFDHHGIPHQMPSGLQDDLYRSGYRPTHTQGIVPSHARHSSSSTAYSSELSSPADSPPNHNLSNPALNINVNGLNQVNLNLKSHPGLRQTHIRARAATSPYPRDAESVYSSSSENEDMSMYFSNPSPPDYSNMYLPGAQPQNQLALHQHQQDAFHAAGQFGRMTLGPDHALEQLAANVRAATTTSASDRAKQIFVQAW